MNAKDPKPSQELHSREALAPVFADLNQYDATTHFVGQSTIFTLGGDRATGEAYCLAHHVTVEGGRRRLMVASLRYLDTFVKMDSSWLFAERRLYVDWLEEPTIQQARDRAEVLWGTTRPERATSAGSPGTSVNGRPKRARECLAQGHECGSRARSSNPRERVDFSRSDRAALEKPV
jgi:hypothetical protein